MLKLLSYLLEGQSPENQELLRAKAEELAIFWEVNSDQEKKRLKNDLIAYAQTLPSSPSSPRSPLLLNGFNIAWIISVGVVVGLVGMRLSMKGKK